MNKTPYWGAPLNCLTPGCATLARRRGCCHRCFGRHARAVHAGTTTWEALEAAGSVRAAAAGKALACRALTRATFPTREDQA